MLPHYQGSKVILSSLSFLNPFFAIGKNHFETKFTSAWALSTGLPLGFNGGHELR